MQVLELVAAAQAFRRRSVMRPSGPKRDGPPLPASCRLAHRSGGSSTQPATAQSPHGNPITCPTARPMSPTPNRTCPNRSPPCSRSRCKQRRDAQPARSSPPKSCASSTTSSSSTPASSREAYVPIEEFKNDQGELEVQVGDFVSVAIDAVENGYGDTILSRDKAKRLASWLSLENSLESGEFVTGTVNGKVKGGLTVLVNGIRAFLPGSLLDTRPVKDMTPVRGQDDGVQGHQARPQAQQRRAVAPRRGRSLDGRRARQADGDAARRRDRPRRGQEHHRVRRVRRPRRHRRPAAHHRHGLAPRAPPERSGAGRPGARPPRC